MGENKWYSNKDLLELINQTRIEFKDLQSELKQTRYEIRKYNGLREDLHEMRIEVERLKERSKSEEKKKPDENPFNVDEIRLEIERMKALSKGKATVGKGIREWGGWIVAILSLLWTIYIGT